MKINSKRFYSICIIFITLIGIVACETTKTNKQIPMNGEEHEEYQEENKQDNQDKDNQSIDHNTNDIPNSNDDLVQTEPPVSEDRIDEQVIICSTGNNIAERFVTPNGYTRDYYKKDSFGTFVREYALQADQAKVHLYDGREKGNQSVVAAVFSMKLGDQDLQQCADSVIRMYAEYFYSKKEYDRMKFRFVSGFECNYSKWKEGYRVKVQGNKVVWKKTAEKDNSYECFEKYLNIVFSYASTISINEESKKVDMEEVRIGDIFIQAGSPGHVVMVVDVCTDEQGKKAILLAQGYMPAQEFHVIVNPRHEMDPWYYEEEIESPFTTAEYTFEDGSCRRLQY